MVTKFHGRKIPKFSWSSQSNEISLKLKISNLQIVFYFDTIKFNKLYTIF